MKTSFCHHSLAVGHIEGTNKVMVTLITGDTPSIIIEEKDGQLVITTNGSLTPEKIGDLDGCRIK